MSAARPLVAMAPKELEDWLTREGQPRYRASQIMEGVHSGIEIRGMSTLPAALRARLESEFTPLSLSVASTFDEPKSATKKYIFSAADDIIFEGVSLAYESGMTQCVSTQAGCRMRCVFCASGRGGLIRNLESHEMLSQVILAERETGMRTGHVVLMGSGEPLDNYDQVSGFISLLLSRGLSRRKITLSTCGVVPGIRRMTREKLFVNLAVSLHHPFHGGRSRLMPAELAWPVEDVVAAANEFSTASGRRVTYEYCVIEGENDTPECCGGLASLIGSSGSLINLIPLNSEGSGSSSGRAVDAFASQLRRRGLSVTVRRKLGSSINAACGQLSAKANPRAPEMNHK